MMIFKTPQFKALYGQTMPMLIGLFAIMGSQLVDSAFIGQLGASPLAVVGFSIPIYQVIIGIQVGIGIATTACISTAVGSKNDLYAKQLGTIVLCIGIITISILCCWLWVYQEAVASYLGAEPALLPLLRSYWFPWLISSWLGAILYFGYSICRSHGETRIPGKVMVITSVLNVVLDPIFIFTLDMGLAGAAWATNVSFIVGCFIIFKAVMQRQFTSKLRVSQEVIKGIKAIIRFTIPAMLSQFIPPISAILVTIIIASYGDFAIGAWGLANRIEYISIILILALTMALPPMIGKLRGKKEIGEILQLVKVAIAVVLLVQLTLAIILLITANPIAHVLTSDVQVRDLLQYYLWIVPVSYAALGACMVSVSASNAMGLPTTALLISLLRLFACYLPLIWIGSVTYGLVGIFIGATVGNILSGVVSWSMFLRQYHKLQGRILTDPVSP